MCVCEFIKIFKCVYVYTDDINYAIKFKCMYVCMYICVYSLMVVIYLHFFFLILGWADRAYESIWSE